MTAPSAAVGNSPSTRTRHALMAKKGRRPKPTPFSFLMLSRCD
jgi:hypothetical protein